MPRSTSISKERLRSNSNPNYDVVDRIANCLAKYVVELNYQYAIEKMEDREIKGVEFEGLLDDHGIGVLNLKYNFINDEGEKDYMESKLYMVSLPFDRKTILIRCLHGKSFACSTLDGRKVCNFSAGKLIELVKKSVEKLEYAIDA